MTTWGWIAIIAVVAMIILSWLLVMGPDPRKWRGGDIPEEERKHFEGR